MRTIEVVVRSDGQSSVETKGFVGAKCLEASRFLEEALGSSRGDKRTVEFYSAAVSTGVEVSNRSSDGKESM
tara:strand:- start:1190 stop:1405 length:216 start_codon:yes stop_codon:yes gene_type:complete